MGDIDTSTLSKLSGGSVFRGVVSVFPGGSGLRGMTSEVACRALALRLGVVFLNSSRTGVPLGERKLKVGVLAALVEEVAP